MTALTMLSMAVLADGTPTNTGPDFGKASPFGLLVIVLLLVGTFFLVWSMNRHLRKLPTDFGTEQSAPAETSDEPATEAVADVPDDTNRDQGGQPTG